MPDKQPFSSADITAVPPRYIGVWSRLLYEHNDTQDETSIVLWMQSQYHHIDVRIPIERIDIRRVNRLEEYTHLERITLAKQQGFAGITHVSANTCLWKRELDFQPDNNSRDYAKMAFDGQHTLLETGIDAAYLEIWKKIEEDRYPGKLEITSGNDRFGQKVTAYQMRIGKYIAYIRPRAVEVPPANSLLEAIDMHQPNEETLLDWLDFEISFGERLDAEHWKVIHSTLPFKENCIMKLQQSTPIVINNFETRNHFSNMTL